MPETNVIIAIVGGLIVAFILLRMVSGGDKAKSGADARRYDTQAAVATAPKKRTLVVGGPYTK